MAHGQGGAEIGFDRGPTLTCNHEAPIAAYRVRTANTSSNGWGIQEEVTHTLDCAQGVAVAHTTHTLRGEGFDASEDGTGRGTPLVPVGVAIHGTDPTVQKVASYDEVAQCLRARTPGNIDNSSTTVVQQPVAFGISNQPTPKFAKELAPSLDAKSSGGGRMEAVAYSTKLHNTASNQAGKVYKEYTTSLDRSSPPSALLTAMQVRRLTPEECERLQGFPDGYTAIPWRKKPASECPDGPRYKALGNSWAVPNVRWIGQRIDAAVRRLR